MPSEITDITDVKTHRDQSHDQCHYILMMSSSCIVVFLALCLSKFMSHAREATEDEEDYEKKRSEYAETGDFL